MQADLLLARYPLEGFPNYRLKANGGAVAVDVDGAQWDPLAFILRLRGRYPFALHFCTINSGLAANSANFAEYLRQYPVKNS